MKTVRVMVTSLGIIAGVSSMVGCTQEEVDAVLTGVQVVADELDESDDVSFRDWLSSELED